MAADWTPKEGTGTIFRNKFKTESKHPDWRGDFMLDGKVIEVSLWDNSNDRGPYYSGRIQLKRPKRQEGF